ncbi:hypothetical protein [Bacillus cereus]|uniref:hypothetical protein n=1 Tax=Bacillus cereus TaxID=1396 RepID=UPI001680CFDC|nr:hypothetical protein [Bacillus cereus]
MNGVLSATRMMKGHEVVKRCAVARKNPEILEVMEFAAKKDYTKLTIVNKER